MASLPTHFLTPEQYLELDSRAERPSEYHDGEMYEIEATTVDHSRIQRNLMGLVDKATRSGSCEALGNTVRVQVSKNRYCYPDLIVACGKLNLASYDTLLNPAVIFEILSPTTADYDLGRKGEMYRTIPSLQEYIVIEQELPRVQRWTRQPAEEWLVQDFKGLNAILPIAAIDCEIPLANLYRDIQFAPEPPLL